MTSQGLVCLLPARNCEADLPGYFASVARFADAVVALDDGSTDATGEILRNRPEVPILLENPRRESYVGWDDAANRQRLLEAAQSLHPRWILWLDADERISADDGEALLAFLEQGALPGVAYGFAVHRMVEDLKTYDKCGLRVYRLFRNRRGQRLPSSRLHFVPVPTDIPRARWLDTTLRIQHLSSLTEARRRARYQKYCEADPERRYQRSYRNILDPPRATRPWSDRLPGQSVVVDPDRHAQLASEIVRNKRFEEDLDPDRPALSVIVISQNDAGRIGPVMEALVGQRVDQPIEFILVNSGSDGTASFVRQSHPEVRVVQLSRPVLPGVARNAGLKLARGDYVSFPGSHVVLPPGSLQHRIDAHALGFSMVTGTALNGTHSVSGWASYFLDHSEALPGRPSSPLSGPPSHCSYMREPLLSIGEFPEDRRAGEDTVVNAELFRRGYQAYRAATIQFVHRSPCTNPPKLIRHHFQRGWAFGQILWERSGRPVDLRSRLRTAFYLVGSYPWRRARYITRNVLRWGRPQLLHFVLSVPLIFAGIASAAAGALAFLFRGAPGVAPDEAP